MANDEQPTYLSLLPGMRDELAQTRRSNIMDNNLNGVVGAQEKLDVIDRAITDELGLAKSANAQMFLKNL